MLTAGAKGAGGVAHAAGIARVLDQAVEEAIVRALPSPAAGLATRSVAAAVDLGLLSLAGQISEMRFLSIRLISLDSQITFGRVLRRAFAAILSLLPLALGYSRRHSWHDRLTHTEVIYDAIARAQRTPAWTPTSVAAARHGHRQA